MKHRSIFAAATAFALSGCGGLQGTQPPSFLSVPAQATNASAHKPKPLLVSPVSLTFSSAVAQTFLARESKYTGVLTITSSDTKVAIVNPSAHAGPSARLTVTPIGGGKCTIAVRDTNGQTARVKISVSGEIIIINTRRDNSSRERVREL